MGFPPDVAESALLECGRCCCICHKFCGTKIELHHIVQKQEGGKDSYDNCIPLCFDCHAEVKTYNPKHPKGRKYTSSELKAHRNRWYEKVSKSHGITANPDYIELDRKVFTELRAILPSDKGAIPFLRAHDYGASYPCDIHHDLHKFLYNCTKPEFEFIDMDLEGCRAKLSKNIDDFLKAVGLYIFSLDNRPDRCRVPKEWSYGSEEQKKEWRKAVELLNELKTQVFETYDELIRIGRRKLAVH